MMFAAVNGQVGLGWVQVIVGWLSFLGRVLRNCYEFALGLRLGVWFCKAAFRFFLLLSDSVEL